MYIGNGVQQPPVGNQSAIMVICDKCPQVEHVVGAVLAPRLPPVVALPGAGEVLNASVALVGGMPEVVGTFGQAAVGSIGNDRCGPRVVSFVGFGVGSIAAGRRRCISGSGCAIAATGWIG